MEAKVAVQFKVKSWVSAKFSPCLCWDHNQGDAFAGVHTVGLSNLQGGRDDNQGERNQTEFDSDTKSMLVNTFKQVETGNRFLGVVHARDYRWWAKNDQNSSFLKVKISLLSNPLPLLIFLPDGQRARATAWARRRRCWTSTCSPTRRRTTTAESSSMRSRRSAVSLLRWLSPIETNMCSQEAQVGFFSFILGWGCLSIESFSFDHLDPGEDSQDPGAGGW